MSFALVTAFNPSVDVEWRVNRVEWEEKNLLLGERRWPGGKGINVVRWLKHLDCPAELLLPLGGDPGREIAAGLRREKLRVRMVPLSQSTRVNVIVTTRRQGQLRFNPPGPTVTERHWRRLSAEVRRSCRSAACLVLSGSLPLGLPADAYAQLIQAARMAGIPALLDCEGEPLRRAVPAGPFLVKPNAHELRAWRPTAWRGSDPARAAAHALSRATGGWVLLTQGADPAFLVHAREGQCFTARPPKVRAVNTVGAGDALLAAVTANILRGAPPMEWLRHGLAAGAATAATPAGELASPSRVAILANMVRVSGVGEMTQAGQTI